MQDDLLTRPVLDACCGSRIFWFDRQDARAVYVDKRNETYVTRDSSNRKGTRTIVVSPDLVADFTNLPFPDNHFAMVIFDPPHLLRCGETGWLGRKYGKLRGNWKDELRSGFGECFRVLKREGTLIFKWSETDIPVSEILQLTPEKPLVGNHRTPGNTTHWLVFLKS